jgi:hypothetical protein
MHSRWLTDSFAPRDTALAMSQETSLNRESAAAFVERLGRLPQVDEKHSPELTRRSRGERLAFLGSPESPTASSDSPTRLASAIGSTGGSNAQRFRRGRRRECAAVRRHDAGVQLARLDA